MQNLHQTFTLIRICTQTHATHEMCTWAINIGNRVWTTKVWYFILVKVVLFTRNLYLTLPSFKTIIFFRAKIKWVRVLQDPSLPKSPSQTSIQRKLICVASPSFHRTPPQKHEDPLPLIRSQRTVRQRTLTQRGQALGRVHAGNHFFPRSTPALEPLPNAAPSFTVCSCGPARGERPS